VLVNTPKSTYLSNTESMRTVITVNEDGSGEAKVNYSLLGAARDNLLMYYHDLKEDEKRRFLLSDIEWKHPDVLEISNSKDKAIPYQVSAKMEYEKIYAFNAGSKLFFAARLYPIFDEDIPENENRARDYYFTNPYQSFDTTIYKFPANYTLETMPKNKSVKFPFAEYECMYSWDAASRSLSSFTVLRIKDRIVAAADYKKLVDFRKQVMADMNEKIVMKKE